VVCDGNSLTAGSGASANMDFPAQLAALLPENSVVWNYGVAGQTTVDMETDAAAQIDILFTSVDNPLRGQFLLGWEATNDSYFGATAAQVIAHLDTYYTNRKAAARKVVAFTQLPRQDAGVPGNFETDRVNTTNPWLRDPARIGVEFDYLCDVAAISQLSDPTNTTYYDADKVHLNDAGYTLVANLAYSTISAALVQAAASGGTYRMDHRLMRPTRRP